MRKSVPILMYHLIRSRQVRGFEKYTVTPLGFSTELAWPVHMGCMPSMLDELVGARCGRSEFLLKPVIITFYDGYLDRLVYALPVLRDLGLTATMFLVAGLIGRMSIWLVPERGIEDIPPLSWADAERVRDPVQRGSHALTHTRLTELPPAACKHELEESRRLLGERLGYAVDHASFPHGCYDAVAQKAARDAGYRSVCSVKIGLSPPDNDIFALHRVPVNGHDALPDFICKLRTSHSISDLARQKTRTLWRAQNPDPAA
jgi:peptidoglycan/xylan/chitin deacetylase (PgdA/CDA1 family)